MNQGLIGHWTPGLGDPSIGGWVTVVLYAGAALTVLRLLLVWNTARKHTARHEHWFWRVLFAGLVLLGINKQLDLQSALTEIGRILADKQGWYEDRRQIQMAFIAGIAMMGLTLIAAMLNLTWGAPASAHWALLGGVGLVIFVIIRAASFHHVDEMLGQRFSGLQINWLLEMGMLSLIAGSAWRRRGQH